MAKTMYPAMANSPGTELSADITAAATTITVINGNALPAAPNLFTIGSDETAETVLYTGKSGNNLTGCTRGFDGTTAKGWATGAKVARYFTAYDHDTFRGNITDLDSRVTAAQTKADAAETPAGAQAKADDAQQAAEEYSDGNLAAHLADYTLQIPYAIATGTANVYAISLPISALVAGMAVTVKINVASTAASTLNWNGKGAKGLKKADGTDITNLKANGVYTFRYDGANFIVQGEGGEYGTATAGDVRSTKTLGTSGGIVNGALDLSALIPQNIKSGVVIDGVVGSLPKINLSKGTISVTASYTPDGITYSGSVVIGFRPKFLYVIANDATSGSGGTTSGISIVSVQGDNAGLPSKNGTFKVGTGTGTVDIAITALGFSWTANYRAYQFEYLAVD